MFYASFLAPGRRQSVATRSGGILAHFVLTLLALLMWWLFPWGRAVWLLTAVLNAVFGAVNLIPCQVRIGRVEMPSDGRQMLDVLRAGVRLASPPHAIHTLAALQPLWRDIGDNLGQYVHLLAAAGNWLELGVYAARKEGPLAEAAYLRAMAAAQELWRMLNEPVDRIRFAACQAPLLAEATACLEQPGKGEGGRNWRRSFRQTGMRGSGRPSYGGRPAGRSTAWAGA